MLDYHADRLASSGLPLIVATTLNQTDDPIVSWCLDRGVKYYRGDEQNVLARYHGAAHRFDADIIIRVTSDCPLIDGELIRIAVEKYISTADEKTFMSNSLELTYPRGLDFAIFNIKMLNEAMEEADDHYQLEHVTPFFRQQPTRYRHISFHQENNDSDIRITLDTTEDFQLIRKLIEEYTAENLTTSEIIQLIRKYPELLEINKNVVQK